MKKMIKITTLLFTVIMLSAQAQLYGPKPGSPGNGNPKYNANNYSNANSKWGKGNNKGYGNGYNKGYNKNYNKGYNINYYNGYKGGWYGPKKYYGGGINVIIGGGYPNGGWYSSGGGYGNYYGNYYYNQWGYSVKRSARYSLQMAGAVINDAVAFNAWNDTYSPILAKAIRHYQYSKKLYYYGNFNAALNHAERARYLASYSFQYFQNGGCDDGFGYNTNGNGGYNGQDPYGNPYDPYYNQTNPNSNNGNGNIDPDYYDDEQYKKSVNPTGNNVSPDNGNVATNGTELMQPVLPKDDAIDKQLPGSTADDKNLIKSFKHSDVKEE